MTIEKILSRIQRDLKAPKQQYNSFAKYKYRSCEDIVEAVKPLLPEDAYLTLSDEIQMFGSHLYVIATAELSWGGLSVKTTGCARETLDKKGMDSGQMTGTASSYARKYALNGLFAIDDTKDADSDEHKKDSNAKADKAPPVDDKRKLAEEYVNGLLLAIKVFKDKELLNEMLADNEEKLERIRKGYPDLSAAINTAVENRKLEI